MKHIINFDSFEKYINISNLPLDIQELLNQFFEDSNLATPIKFKIIKIPLDKIQNTINYLDKERGVEYAKQMIGIKKEPIIIWNNKLLDGYHRIAASYIENIKYIYAIDLSEYPLLGIDHIPNNFYL